ncbi:NAD(P)H-binding protein [Polyangium sp. y55x31]|uniref:NAD(P)H-binding protein n=1 Tax=Polyangium sp. y55x31 TaxID=3042688 RepID=UPI0024830DF7|nr:NAD(P)H-binding protein [Polyangium sp. y55x31]MDI1479257.1 NAD(P)H-binding protein [Polyangium sp. y55x31]
MSILITGVSGNTGSLIAERLREKGVPFRAMVRSPRVRERLARQGMNAVLGDFDEPKTLAIALAGIEKAYLVCTPNERMEKREAAFIDSARAAGVEKLVKLSAFRANVNGRSRILRAHGRIEQKLVESGMDYVIVRPHGFMQTFVLSNEELIRKAGAYILPAGEGRAPLVDLRDVARACVNAILEDEHVGKAFDVTGPHSLTFGEQAALLSSALQRPVTYIAGSDRMLDRAFAMFGVPEMAREHAKVVFRMIRDGELADVGDGLQRLGVTPTPYATFASDFASGKTIVATSFPIPNGLKFQVQLWLFRMLLNLRFALLGRGRA